MDSFAQTCAAQASFRRKFRERVGLDVRRLPCAEQLAVSAEIPQSAPSLDLEALTCNA